MYHYREYGVILLGDNPATAADVALALAEEGLVKCRDNCSVRFPCSGFRICLIATEK